jgi:carbonic anhydrase
MSNNGHGTTMTLSYEKGVRVHTFGGPLRNPHTLVNFHLHWPSEHTLNGRRFAAEIHLVYYNERYFSFEQAATQSDGLAVLGFFFEIDDTVKTNDYLKLLQTVRIALRDDKTIKPEEQVSVYDIIGIEPIEVYSYNGSLTTPPCSQNVNWMVATRTLKITTAELEALQKIEFDTGNKIKDNYRPIQGLFNRRVTLY